MPPRERQKLQQRTPSALGNVSDRYYREGNVEGMKKGVTRRGPFL